MNDIAEKIHLIERLSSNPSATGKLLDKVIESLVESDRRKLAGFRAKLAEFEQKHGMSTAEFQARFDAGELGDAPEWFDWDGYAALAASLENKLVLTCISLAAFEPSGITDRGVAHPRHSYGYGCGSRLALGAPAASRC